MAKLVGFNAYIDSKEDALSFMKNLLNKLEELEQENAELREQNTNLAKVVGQNAEIIEELQNRVREYEIISA